MEAGPVRDEDRVPHIVSLFEDETLLDEPPEPVEKKTTRYPLSKRNERCGSCGDPTFVCPGVVRHYVRCCGRCSHWTAYDEDWEDWEESRVRARERLPRPDVT